MYKFKKNYYADIRIEDRTETAITIYNNVLQNNKVKHEKKAFLRVYDGQMWYYASTCNVDSIQKELDELYAMAKPNTKISENPIVKIYEVNKERKLCYADNNVNDVAHEEKMKKLNSTYENLKSEIMSIHMGVYIDRHSDYEFYSSKGADLHFDYQNVGMRIIGIFSDAKSQVTNVCDACSDAFDKVDISKETLEDAAAEAENYLKNVVDCEQGRFPAVLSNVTTGVFAHESFGHKSEADFMLGDETMAKEWQIGKKVANELLTICDSGTLAEAGYTPYDDEGTKAKMNYLIKDGVLAGRLHSATTAAYLNEGLTGNARAINCDFEPIVRMTNTYIVGGKSKVEELIAGIKDGYYIKTIKHGSGMSTFTIAPEIAYRIRDGKIAEPVRIGVITGNVFETLGLIDGVADDFMLLSFVQGGCGKMEQYPLSVGLGGPHIRVSEINVQ